MEVTQNKYENWINKNKFTYWMNSFVNSEWFIILIGILVLISNCFAQELVCFGLIALLSTLALIISKDTKSLIFPLLTFQMGMSYKNGISYNPHPELPTIYDNTNVIIYLSIIGGLVILGAIFNFFIFKQYKNKFNHIIYLLPGLCALTIGYLLSGCINHFSINNFIYSASNSFMVVGIYIYFSLTAFKYGQNHIKFISKIMIFTSFLIGIELIHIYLTNNVIEDLNIYKDRIQNGWGISNNFAGYFNICLPFTTYLIISEKRNVKYYFSYLITCLGIIMTSSRNGYIIMILNIIICIILLLVLKKDQRKKILSSIIISLILLTIICVIFRKQIYQLFIQLINYGFDLSNRKDLYEIAWKAFLKNPIFGQGWFLFGNEGYIPPTSFAPSYKAHNFVLQLLGSTGIFGFLCFLGLISSIFYVALKNKSKEKILLLSAILVLLSTSIVDNFFFDYGFERYFAIFLVGIAIELKKENVKVIETKEAIVNE